MRWIAGLGWAVVFWIGWVFGMEIYWNLAIEASAHTEEAFATAFETGIRCSALWGVASLVMGLGGAGFRALPGTRGSRAPEGNGRGVQVVLLVAWLVVGGFTVRTLHQVVDARAAGKTTLTPEQRQALKQAAAQQPAVKTTQPSAATKTKPRKARSKARKAKPVPGLPGHYSYTDAKGTKHIVNSFDKIPKRYR